MSKSRIPKVEIEIESIHVVLLGESHLAEAANLINHVFCTANPVWQHFVND